MTKRLLLFGASGAIGTAILDSFLAGEGWQVTAVSRQSSARADRRAIWLNYDPYAAVQDFTCFDASAPYAAVCWAQGANHNDSVRDVEAESNIELYRANALFNVITLRLLLERRLLTRPAKLCVISSIWQTLARQNKLSYCMSKAALQGFVLSAAADLATEGHLINAVLPGALDTPMTRKNLSADQISAFTNATHFRRLPALGDVVGLVRFLCSDSNTGITGQFIGADLGFSHVRLL